MKTHGESRRLPFKVGPMEAEGCPVTPSQDSTGVNTCILHLLVRVSQGPEIPWSLTWVARGVLCWGVCNWDQVSWSAKSVLDCPLLKLLIAYFSMAWCQTGARHSWSACCFSQFWGHLDFLTSFKKGPSIAWYNFDPLCKCFITGHTCCCMNNYSFFAMWS